MLQMLARLLEHMMFVLLWHSMFCPHVSTNFPKITREHG
jgi:hypothetical protein